jgi:hypothetical protein
MHSEPSDRAVINQNTAMAAYKVLEIHFTVTFTGKTCKFSLTKAKRGMFMMTK